MSFRLEPPRPPPLSIRSSPHLPPSSVSPTTLLYDLPQSSSRSPPPDSPTPASPTRQRTRATPPHSRSATPAPLARQELDKFAAHCHAWYFDQDEHAGQLMTQTIESLPPSQRAPYTRLQANIRSAFHTAMRNRRSSEFRAHLSSIHPACSLPHHARTNPYGKVARRERRDRFARFLRTWCTPAMPGTSPFFHALWALLRLQVLPVELGGAGPNRIEWELDDAVFQESAGKEFMLEAIDVLKGWLGFEEYLPRPHPRLSHDLHDPPTSPPIPLSPPTRPRSLSDPFLDTPTHSSSTTTSRTLKEIPSTDPTTSSSDTSADCSPRLRLWSAPDLDNPELQRLAQLFPTFIARQALPRFDTDIDPEHDLEEGSRDAAVRCGTGRLWVGERARRDGWGGGWWDRFAGWWRRLFSC